MESSPLFRRRWRQRRVDVFVARECRFRCDHSAAKAWPDCEAGTPAAKLALYKPNKPQPALLPPPVPTVRKCHDASSWAAGALAAPRLFITFSSEVGPGSREENASKG